MLWLAWILVAIICAVLFSVIKTLDRVTYAVQLLDARIDRMAAGVEELTALVNMTPGRLEHHAPPSPTALGSARTAIHGSVRTS
jgi:hypothetical protein